MSQSEAVIYPLYIGLTRPATTFGVPLVWYAVLFTLVGMGMIGFLAIKAKLYWALTVGGGGYVFGLIMTERDPHWMLILWAKMTMTPPTRNRNHWKSNSYAP
jgi:type IV secretory pathway VirB3-like protein